MPRMQLSVNGKQIDIGDSLREYVARQLPSRVTKYFDRPTDAEVTFSRDGKRFRADIAVHVGRAIYANAHASSEDAYAAFDQAAEHVAKRLRRYKRRLREHHRGEGRDESLSASHFVLEAEPEEGEEPNSGTEPVVVAEMAMAVETLTVGEAVMRMDLSGQGALLFRNRAHGGLNMIYRRNDGNIGWVDPQHDTTS